jgi:arylsulfatase A-like enzyme
MRIGRPIAMLLTLVLIGAAPAPSKPNIIILLADDWGFTDVGAFGGEIHTPNIDALAAAGVRFSNFHVAGSCSPTRAMLQTGVSNHRAGLGNMPETIPPEHRGKWGYDAALNDRVVTIADQLRRGGYRTYLTGKWHLGKSAGQLPTARGYDHAFALAASGADNFEEKPNLLIYDHADWTEDGRPAHLPRDYYSSRFIVDKMIAYIDAGRASGKPFLASLNFLANHIPVQAPDPDIAAYKDRYAKGWDALRAERRRGAIAKGVMPPGMAMVRMNTTDHWNALSPGQKAQRGGAMAAYGAMATAMDREIGRLVAHLKATGAYENSIFLFLSDNGGEALDPMTGGIPTWTANHYYDQSTAQQGRPGSLTAIGTSFASAVSAPLRGYKFTASEGGLRVPFIMAWPGNAAIKPGRVSDAFAYVTDIAPTLLSLADVAPQKGAFGGRVVEPMTGYNLAPLLTNTVAATHPPLVPLGYELSGNAVLFKGDYKLVKNLPPYGDSRWALYDIVRDPGEAVDLSATETDRFQAMKADYAAFAKRDHILPMPAGYSAPKQVQDNAIHDLLFPRLLRLWPWAAGLILGLFGLAWLRRRRRNQARG